MDNIPLVNSNNDPNCPPFLKLVVNESNPSSLHIGWGASAMTLPMSVLRFFGNSTAIASGKDEGIVLQERLRLSSTVIRRANARAVLKRTPEYDPFSGSGFGEFSLADVLQWLSSASED